MLSRNGDAGGVMPLGADNDGEMSLQGEGGAIPLGTCTASGGCHEDTCEACLGWCDAILKVSRCEGDDKWYVTGGAMPLGANGTRAMPTACGK
jgi:hypothetical protein